MIFTASQSTIPRLPQIRTQSLIVSLTRKVRTEIAITDMIASTVTAAIAGTGTAAAAATAAAATATATAKLVTQMF